MDDSMNNERSDEKPNSLPLPPECFRDDDDDDVDTDDDDDSNNFINKLNYEKLCDDDMVQKGGGRAKDLVHKCPSDPGKVVATSSCLSKQLNQRTSLKYPSSGGPLTRKCVLTLDGYSYVIGENFCYFIQN